jgi:hypothetical protein
VETASGFGTYLLCNSCKDHLERRALKPREWYNLAALHGWEQYELFDDFYDQDGVACAPETAFPVSSEPPALRLDEVEYDLDRLVAYCRTRWSLSEREYEALKRFPTESVLARCIELTEGHNPDPTKVNLALRLAGRVLKDAAADFVRQVYTSPGRSIFEWAEAASVCLPPTEGFLKTIDELESLDSRQLYGLMGALAVFRSQAVIDWIEKNVPQQNVGDNWGRLAANSGLSWTRAQMWLAAGRPMSLVALDALSAMIPRHPGLTSARQCPGLIGRPTNAGIQAALQRYLTFDDAPRAQRLCAYIANNLDVLASADE